MGKKATHDYSSGTGKRWLIILGVLVLIAIIVVVIIIAIPPNTSKAIEALNTTSKTSYLSSTSEQNEFNKFRTKVNTSTVNAYTIEIDSISILSDTIDDVLDYYNNYLVFAKDSKVLKNNYKDIKEGLEDAKESQKRMNKILAKTNELSNQSYSYLKNALVDYRKAFADYLNSCNRTIVALKKVYAGSLGEVSFNNPASEFILNTTNDYIDVIGENFNTLIKRDIKGGDIATYNTVYSELGLSAKINLFNTFVKNFLNNENNTYDIENYYFDSNLQNKYDLLNEFFEIYSQENAKEIIDSINSSSEITKIFEGVTDENGTYDAICSFLKGGN